MKSEYSAEWSSKGGKTTAKRYGAGHFRRIGKLGAAGRWGKAVDTAKVPWYTNKDKGAYGVGVSSNDIVEFLRKAGLIKEAKLKRFMAAQSPKILPEVKLSRKEIKLIERRLSLWGQAAMYMSSKGNRVFFVKVDSTNNIWPWKKRGQGKVARRTGGHIQNLPRWAGVQPNRVESEKVAENYDAGGQDAGAIKRKGDTGWVERKEIPSVRENGI